MSPLLSGNFKMLRSSFWNVCVVSSHQRPPAAASNVTKILAMNSTYQSQRRRRDDVGVRPALPCYYIDKILLSSMPLLWRRAMEAQHKKSVDCELCAATFSFLRSYLFSQPLRSRTFCSAFCPYIKLPFCVHLR